MRLRFVEVCAFSAAFTLRAQGALAEEPPKEEPSSKLEEAKLLFEQGNAFRKSGDCERAVPLFERSRALFASVPNTLNAAVCLTDLGRSDEALELHEVLLTRFRAALRAEELSWLGSEIARLRQRVGDIDVVGDAGAEVAIDGRPRRNLPLGTPLHVLSGKRTVRVTKPGRKPFLTEIVVGPGVTHVLRVTLEGLAVAGRLRIESSAPEKKDASLPAEDAREAGVTAYVDGAPVGTVPWEGVVAPGVHHVRVERGELGSMPTRVVVAASKTAIVRPELAPLGPEVLVRTIPKSADIAVDSVSVGKGFWVGRLPVGKAELSVREEGYETLRQELDVRRGAPPVRIDARLDVNERHPRWALLFRRAVWIEALGGFGIAGGLASGAEGSCTTFECRGSGPAYGFLAAGRVGYEVLPRFSLILLGGYTQLERGLERAKESSFHPREQSSVRTTYRLKDRLRLSGIVVLAGGGFTQPLGAPFELATLVTAGPFFASGEDRVTGTVSAEGATAPVDVAGVGGRGIVSLAIMPELRFGVRRGGLSASVGFALLMLPLDGPKGKLGDVTVRAPCDPSQPRRLGCAPGEALVAGEQLYGPTIAFFPSAAVRKTF